MGGATLAEFTYWGPVPQRSLDKAYSFGGHSLVHALVMVTDSSLLCQRSLAQTWS